MFEVLGVKWGEPEYGEPSGTINWTADLGGLPTGAGFTVADLDSALESAFAAWEAVAAIDFLEVTSGADVTIGSASLGGSVAGVATFGPVLPGLNTLNFGEIEFNSDFSWAPNGEGRAVDFYAVAVHEIGHIIGLAHVDDTSQIMNPVIYADDLGRGDVEGAQFIYGTDAGDPAISAGGDGGGGGGGMGLLLGLLALIAGLFGLAPGGAVAMAAAGRVPDHDDDYDGENALDYLPGILIDDEGGVLDCGHDGHEGGHPVYVPVVYLAEGVSLPAVEHTSQPNACGCFGECEHLHDHLDDLDDLVA